VRTTLLAAAALLAAGPAFAQVDCTTPGEAWTIESFHSDYVVRPNGSVGVTERLEVDYGTSRKHGIFRDIGIRVTRPFPGFGAEEELRWNIDVHSVTDETGEDVGMDVSREGDFRRIRIGSPDFCVNGRQVYVIRYEISRGVRSFGGYDELYWQVTGTTWPVPIRRADATVTLPPDRAMVFADSQPWHVDCYAGTAASTSGEGCAAEVVTPGSYRIATTAPLDPGEGLTFSAAFPVGVIPGPTDAERAADALMLWGPLAIPPLALLLMLGVWLRHGREPSMGSIVPRWDPPEELRPGPAGTLVDQKADMDDVIATVLDLAVRGHIRIREIPPKVLPGIDSDSFLGKALGAVGLQRAEWEFVRVKSDDSGLAGFERKVLDGILDGQTTRRMSDLKEKFYKDLPGIRDALYADLVAQGLFDRSPQTTRRWWVAGGIALLLVGVAFGVVGFAIGAPLVLPAFVIAGVVVLVFAWFMPAMTPKGARARVHVDGLEEYIRRAEKAELEFHQSPESAAELFDRLLPYAVALNVSDIWVRQFEGILTRPPDWYDGRMTGAYWSSTAFGNDLSGFRTAAASTLASSPGGSGGSGSFGGGSVGGGGGGGGGGSW
jgi:hypothetical protein